MGVWTHPDIRRRSAATKQQWGTSLTAFEHLRNVACNTQLYSTALRSVSSVTFGLGPIDLTAPGHVWGGLAGSARLP